MTVNVCMAPSNLRHIRAASLRNDTENEVNETCAATSIVVAGVALLAELAPPESVTSAGHPPRLEREPSRRFRAIVGDALYRLILSSQAAQIRTPALSAETKDFWWQTLNRTPGIVKH